MYIKCPSDTRSWHCESFMLNQTYCWLWWGCTAPRRPTTGPEDSRSSVQDAVLDWRICTHIRQLSSICWQISTSLQSLYTLPSHDSDARSWFRPVVSGNADIYQRFNASVKYLDFKAKFKPKRLLYQPEYLRIQSQIQAQALTLSTQVLRLQSQIQAQALTLSTREFKTSKPNSSPSAYFINPST